MLWLDWEDPLAPQIVVMPIYYYQAGLYQLYLTAYLESFPRINARVYFEIIVHPDPPVMIVNSPPEILAFPLGLKCPAGYSTNKDLRVSEPEGESYTMFVAY